MQLVLQRNNFQPQGPQFVAVVEFGPGRYAMGTSAKSRRQRRCRAPPMMTLIGSGHGQETRREDQGYSLGSQVFAHLPSQAFDRGGAFGAPHSIYRTRGCQHRGWISSLQPRTQCPKFKTRSRLPCLLGRPSKPVSQTSMKSTKRPCSPPPLPLSPPIVPPAAAAPAPASASPPPVSPPPAVACAPRGRRRWAPRPLSRSSFASHTCL